MHRLRDIDTSISATSATEIHDDNAHQAGSATAAQIKKRKATL